MKVNVICVLLNLKWLKIYIKDKIHIFLKNKDIRIVCNLNDLSLLFMANRNSKIDDSESDVNSYIHLTLGNIRDYSEPITIAVDNTDKATYHIVMKIFYLYKFNMDNITVLEEDIFNDDGVLTQFQSGEIDILVANIVHPDDRIKELYQQYKVQFIGNEDIDLANLHVKSPYYKRGSLNLMDYEVELFKTRMLDVFSCPLTIV